MVDFEDTEEGIALSQELDRLARRAEDLLKEAKGVEGSDVFHSEQWLDWLRCCKSCIEVEDKYNHLKQEYEDNNKHYILGDFDE